MPEPGSDSLNAPAPGGPQSWLPPHGAEWLERVAAALARPTARAGAATVGVLSAIRELAGARAAALAWVASDGTEVEIREWIADPSVPRPEVPYRVTDARIAAAMTGADPVCMAPPARAADPVFGAIVPEGAGPLIVAPFPPDSGERAGLLVGLAPSDAAELDPRQARLFRVLAGHAAAAWRLDHVTNRAAELEAARAQVARSHWLTALGQLAAGVAHDLNNSLNPILSFAELIRTHADDAERVRTYADRILLAARDGAETVRRIKLFTRRSASGVPREEVSLAQVVREVVELARPEWDRRPPDRRIVVTVDVDDALVIRANPGELREALLNLVSNAVDAMPGRGDLRFIGRRDGDLAVLSVQDSGEGMPPEVLARAVEPFFTTKGPTGTGLGVPQVWGIVRRFKGDLKIESWPGTGTTALLRIPLAGQAAPAAAAVPQPSRPAQTYAVLVVDDNALSAEALAAALRAAGHTATTVASAEEALARFRPGEFEWVLTDLGLPGRSGAELVAELRRQDAAVRIGVVTGWSVDEAEEQLRPHGVELVMSKPVDPEELLAVL